MGLMVFSRLGFEPPVVVHPFLTPCFLLGPELVNLGHTLLDRLGHVFRRQLACLERSDMRNPVWPCSHSVQLHSFDAWATSH